MKADEEDQRRRIAYKKAKAERDKLAAELKRIYPPIEAQFRDLMTRIDANDKEIEYINAHVLPRDAERLLVAELVARGLMGFVENSVEAVRITRDLRLPAFRFDRQSLCMAAIAAFAVDRVANEGARGGVNLSSRRVLRIPRRAPPGTLTHGVSGAASRQVPRSNNTDSSRGAI